MVFAKTLSTVYGRVTEVLKHCSPRIASGGVPRRVAQQGLFVAQSAALSVQIDPDDGVAHPRRLLRHGAVSVASTCRQLRPLQAVVGATLPINPIKVHLSSAIDRACGHSPVRLLPVAPEKLEALQHLNADPEALWRSGDSAQLSDMAALNQGGVDDLLQ